MSGSPGTRLAPDLPPGPRAALVIATTSYTDPGLSRLRAPADDAQALAEVLGDPRIGGFTVTTVIDVDDGEARRAIDVFLSGRGTGDLVLVYLSCHGVLDKRNRLYFAATNTLKDQLSSTGISSAWLLERLEECRSRQQILILDCCFSGAFAHGSKGDGDLDLERRLAGNGRGQAVLTASRAGEYSFEGDAVPGPPVSGSVFTAGLIDGLRTGAADVGGDGYVSVDEAYDHASRYVRSCGAAQTPQRWLSGGEGAIVLARSPARMTIMPAALPEDLAATLDSRYPEMRIGAVHVLGRWLAGDDPGRAMTAEQKLRQIADTDNPAVAAAARAYLPDPGRAIATTSPHHTHINRKNDEDAARTPAWEVPEPARRISGRVSRLLADAERIAQSITNELSKASALGTVAKAVAATDPGRAARLLADAERTAQAMTDGHSKASVLCVVAKAMAATDPGRAGRLLADAERIAQSITDEDWKAYALSTVAKAVAASDPDRAERIARSITKEDLKAYALGDIAEAVAASDPDRAERIAQSITGEFWKARTLGAVAEAGAATNPDRAERIAQSITKEDSKASVLCVVAKAVGATDPGRAARLLADAERIAKAMTDEHSKTSVLCGVAEAVAATDPGRAGRLLADAERIAQSITEELWKSYALRVVAVAVAATNPDRAERIAQSITDEDSKAYALFAVAKAVAATNPDRAERTAQSITEEGWKAHTLGAIAEALTATNPDRAERIAQSISEDWEASALVNKVSTLVKIANIYQSWDRPNAASPH